MQKFLTSLGACEEAKKWAKGKTWLQVFTECHRGDWLLWLYKRTNQGDLKTFTLAKAHCANTVRYLMKDKRSTTAIDVAILYGQGKATDIELKVAAAAACCASTYIDDAVDAVDAAVAAYAAADAAVEADYAAYAAAYAAADDATDDTAYAAAVANQLLTANICRKYLPIDMWNIAPTQIF